MASPRVPGIAPRLILPAPPEHGRYDLMDQREVRRILQQSLDRGTLDWATIVSLPQPIEVIAAIPEISSFIVDLLDDTSAAQARSTLDIKLRRSTQPLTTASLANLVSETGFVAMPADVAALLSVQVDRAAWIRLYTTAAARDADLTRNFNVRPTAGTGVLAEFVSTGSQTIPTSPVAWLDNQDGTPVSRVYYNVQNRSGSTSPVAITFGYAAVT